MSGYIGNIPTPQATQTRETFTATASQTTFNTAGYTPGFVDVWLNGVKLVNGDDFTATNGSDVVLTVGAASGDTVEVLSFSTFEVNSQTFTGDTSAVNLNVTGTFTSRGIDDNATSTAMTLDASGNVLVGKTADNWGTTGVQVHGYGVVAASRNGHVVNLNRETTDGDIARFQKNGTTVGSISTVANNIAIGRDDTALYISATTDSITPTTIASGTPVERDGGIDLGRSSARFKNLYLSGGVYLGGTGAANLLDDYETGTFTVTLTASSSGTITIGTQDFTYTKVGRMVHINGAVSLSSVSSPVGYITVAGFPFTSTKKSVASIAMFNSSSSNMADFVAYMNAGSTSMVIVLGDGTTQQLDSAQQMISSTDFHFSMVYTA